MNSIKRISIAACLAVILTASVSSVKADDGNWPTQVTFREPVQFGNMVLAPGTYNIQLAPGTVCRSIVMVYSVDRERWEGIVIGIQARREDVSVMSDFTFENRGSGAPGALRYWFYPGWDNGIKFVYSHTQTSQMSKTKSEPVATIAHSGK